jgi:hypothetical protein
VGRAGKKRGVEFVALKLAAKAILMHLNRIKQMRPLDSIQDSDTRRQAENLRDWFKNEFQPRKL